MNKSDLIQTIADQAGLSKANAAKFVEAFTDVVTDQLKAGEKVSFTGFGTFSVGEREARKGRNPQTGEEVEIPAAKVPKFKAGKALKDGIS